MTHRNASRPARAPAVLPVLFLALLLAASVPGSDAVAAGLRRIDEAWLLPAAMAAEAIGGDVRPTASGAWVRFGHAQLFGVASLPAHSSAIGARHHGMACEAGWDALGGDAFRDDCGRVRVRAGRSVALGIEASLRRVRPGPGSALTRADIDLTIGWQGAAGRLGTCDLRLAVPVAAGGAGALAREPHRRLEIALGGRQCAVALAWSAGADGSPSASWEALCGLGAGLGVLWRADGPSGAVGGGVVWQRGPFRLRTSHLAHPDLGLTHRLEVALGMVQVSPW